MEQFEKQNLNNNQIALYLEYEKCSAEARVEKFKQHLDFEAMKNKKLRILDEENFNIT